MAVSVAHGPRAPGTASSRDAAGSPGHSRGPGGHPAARQDSASISSIVGGLAPLRVQTIEDATTPRRNESRRLNWSPT